MPRVHTLFLTLIHSAVCNEIKSEHKIQILYIKGRKLLQRRSDKDSDRVSGGDIDLRSLLSSLLIKHRITEYW